MREEEDKGRQEPEIATERFTPQQMSMLLNRNPDLKRNMTLQIKSYMSQVLGNLTDQQFNDAMRNPEYKSLKDEAIRDTMRQYNAEIMQAIKQPQGMLSE